MRRWGRAKGRKGLVCQEAIRHRKRSPLNASWCVWWWADRKESLRGGESKRTRALVLYGTEQLRAYVEEGEGVKNESPRCGHVYGPRPLGNCRHSPNMAYLDPL